MTANDGTNDDFSVGAAKWPGVAKLLEESGEVQQVLGKLIAIGGRTEHWSGDLGLMLEEELGDLAAAMAFVIKYNPIDPIKVFNRQEMKRALYEEWRENGLG